MNKTIEVLGTVLAQMAVVLGGLILFAFFVLCMALAIQYIWRTTYENIRATAAYIDWREYRETRALRRLKLRKNWTHEQALAANPPLGQKLVGISIHNSLVRHDVSGRKYFETLTKGQRESVIRYLQEDINVMKQIEGE